MKEYNNPARTKIHHQRRYSEEIPANYNNAFNKFNATNIETITNKKPLSNYVYNQEIQNKELKNHYSTGNLHREYYPREQIPFYIYQNNNGSKKAEITKKSIISYNKINKYNELEYIIMNNNLEDIKNLFMSSYIEILKNFNIAKVLPNKFDSKKHQSLINNVIFLIEKGLCSINGICAVNDKFLAYSHVSIATYAITNKLYKLMTALISREDFNINELVATTRNNNITYETLFSYAVEHKAFDTAIKIISDHRFNLTSLNNTYNTQKPSINIAFDSDNDHFIISLLSMPKIICNNYIHIPLSILEKYVNLKEIVIQSDYSIAIPLINRGMDINFSIPIEDSWSDSIKPITLLQYAIVMKNNELIFAVLNSPTLNWEYNLNARPYPIESLFQYFNYNDFIQIITDINAGEKILNAFYNKGLYSPIKYLNKLNESIFPINKDWKYKIYNTKEIFSESVNYDENSEPSSPYLKLKNIISYDEQNNQSSNLPTKLSDIVKGKLVNSINGTDIEEIIDSSIFVLSDSSLYETSNISYQ